MFQNGELDGTQAQLPERLERPTIKDAVPGSAWIIDADALWVDEDYKVWVNQNCPLEIDSDDCYVSSYAHLIVFDQGLVIDLTVQGEDIKGFSRVSFAEHIDNEDFDAGDFLPVIAVITSTDEIATIKKLFEKTYGIKLSGKSIVHKQNKDKAKNRKQKIKNQD